MYKKYLLGITLASIGAFFWGTAGIITEILLTDHPDISMNWVMSTKMTLAGSLTLIAVLFTKNRKNIFALWKDKKDIVQIFVFAIFGVLSMQYTYLMAVTTSNAAIATVLIFLSPIMIIIYLSFKNKTKPSGREYLAIILAVIGIVLLVTNGNLTTLSITPTALFWGLLAAVANCIYLLQPLQLIKKYSTLPVVGFGMLLAGLIYNFVEPIWNVPKSFDLNVGILIFIIVIFGTLLGTSVYLQSMSYINPGVASLLSSIEPLSATLISIFFLNHSFTTIELTGMLLIVSVVFILASKEQEN